MSHTREHVFAELRCPRDLALKLGAIEPRNVIEHREMNNGAAMLVRDPVTLHPMFWQLVSPSSR